MKKIESVHLGYEVGSGNAVQVPLHHLGVVGMTQLSGKTTTLEALVSRSGRPAVAFVTKRHEGGFKLGRQIPPYFRERADWQFVRAVLEATMREKMKFEQSWIMRACKGAETLADVQRNVRSLMEKAKGLSADVYLQLDAYLEIVVPQVKGLLASTLNVASRNPGGIELQPGINVMDLTAFSTEVQALVIRSVLEWVYQRATNTIVVIPEAWQFIPQNRGSPVLLACEELIRKGGAAGNRIWLDSQDLAGINATIRKSVGVWILGVQREFNEVKRTIAHIPGGIKRPKPEAIMQLGIGHFVACFEQSVITTYVQPIWMDPYQASRIATGETALEFREADVNQQEADALREANTNLQRTNSELTARVATLSGHIEELKRDLAAVMGGNRPEPAGAPSSAEAHPPLLGVEFVVGEILRRAQTDPVLLKVLQQRPELEVDVRRQVIRVDYDKQPGFIAHLIAKCFFDTPQPGAAVVAELKRSGRSVHNANVYRDLSRLAEQGFLTVEADGYRAVQGMKVRIVESDMAA